MTIPAFEFINMLGITHMERFQHLLQPIRRLRC